MERRRTESQRTRDDKAAEAASERTAAAIDREAAAGDVAAAAREAAKKRGQTVAEPSEVGRPVRSDFPEGMVGQSKYAAAVRDWEKKRHAGTPRAEAVKKKLRETQP